MVRDFLYTAMHAGFRIRPRHQTLPRLSRTLANALA
jgi:hypothetical protein